MGTHCHDPPHPVGLESTQINTSDCSNSTETCMTVSREGNATENCTAVKADTWADIVTSNDCNPESSAEAVAVNSLKSPTKEISNEHSVIRSCHKADKVTKCSVPVL